MCLTMCFGFTGCNIETGVKGKDKIEDYKGNPNAEITITLCLLSGMYERAIMNSWANAFQEKYPNVGFDFDDKGRVITAMDGVVAIASEGKGKLPDIIWTGGDQHSPYSERYFLDLKDLEGADEFFDGFYPSLIQSTHVSSTDDGIWFVPRDYNALMVYYNKTLFKKAGVDLPKNNWTYEEFVATCEALDKSGKVYRAVENDIGWHPYSYTMMRNNGLEYFDENGKIILDNEKAEEWYDKLQDFNTKYVVQGAKKAFVTYNPLSNDANVAMYINVRPALPEIAAKANDGGWELGTVTFPNYKQEDGSNGYVGVGCSGYALNKDLANNAVKRDWAWKFLQFCMSEEGYAAASKWGVLVPALKSLADYDGDDSWRNYERGDVSITGDYADAFVKFDATPIDLNYYNNQPVSTHATITSEGAQFWGKTEAGGDSFRTAMNAYITRLKDNCNITK